MGHSISGQPQVQRQNNQDNIPNNASMRASSGFSAAQISSTTPMSQAAILTMLMQLIQELIGSLKGDGRSESKQQSSHNNNANTSNNVKDEGGIKDASKHKDASSSKNTTKSTEGNSAQANGNVPVKTSATGEVMRDTGIIPLSNSGLAGTTAQRGATATSDYNSKFNIDSTLRDCPTCINPIGLTHDHSGKPGTPSHFDPSEFDLNGRPGGRPWGTQGSNQDFQHTFHPPKLAPNQHWKSGTLTLTISRADKDGNGVRDDSLSDNDTVHISSNDAPGQPPAGIVGLGTRRLWQDANGNPEPNTLLSKTITITLTPDQLKSAEDGDFSFLVSDDTAVDKAVLDLQGGTSIPVQNGTSSDDDLKGKTGQPDIIHGREGDDTIDGESGDDCLYGDEGDDHIRGGSGDDKAFGGEGDDILEGGSGDDKLFGNEGDDLIRGGSGDDILFGDEGDDELHGGNGNDTIYALDGNDTVFGGRGDDQIYSGLANTTPYAPGAQHNEIDGGSGDDTVHYAGTRDDYIITAIGNGEWEIQNKDTNKTDIVKHVEHLVFEMEMDPSKKTVDLDTGKSK